MFKRIRMGEVVPDENYGPVLQVHGTGPCGKDVGLVAEVIEPQSANPLLKLHFPLGFNAIQQIMNTVRGIKSPEPSIN